MAVKRRVALLLVLWRFVLSKGNGNSSDPVTQPILSNSLNDQLMQNATSTKTAATSVARTTSSKIQLQITSKPGLEIKATPSLQPVSRNDTNLTVPIVQGPETRSGGLEFWVYLLIGIAVILLTCILVYIFYNRVMNKWGWKDSGSYMVWNDNELQLSPAFTRESEFLLDDIAAAEQALQNSDLQIYEIPLDSVIQQSSRNSIYSNIGGKRVAPRRESGDSVKQKTSRKDLEKQVKKRDTQVNVSSSSGQTSTSIVLSDGSLDSTNSLTRLSKRKSSSPKSHRKKVKGATLPRDLHCVMDSESASKRSRSGSNLIQERPLPETPAVNLKRFSKSLDKLRFFNTLPGRTKANVFSRSRPLPIPPLAPHPPLIKSASIGSNVNNIIHSSSNLGQPPSLPPRRSSVDTKKPLLSHRHSKSLDTLLLLKELDCTAIDIFHSYESVHCSNNNVESPYASVGKRLSDLTFTCDVDRRSSDTPSSLDPGVEEDPDCDALYSGDHPYACVSDQERAKLGSFSLSDCENKQSLSGSEEPEISPAPSLASTLSGTLPYASVRISQIPGCGQKNNKTPDMQYVCSGEVFDGLAKSEEYSSVNSLSRLSRPESYGYSEILPSEAEKENEQLISNTDSYLHVCADANEALNTTDNDSVQKPSSNRSSGSGYAEIPPAEGLQNCDPTSITDELNSNTYLEIIPDNSEIATNPSGTPQYSENTGSGRHSYLEILPDRSSIISETSSGYARPVDLMTSGYVSDEMLASENTDENVIPSIGVYDNVANTNESNCEHQPNINGIENSPISSSLGCYDNLNPKIFGSTDKNSNPADSRREPNHFYDNLFPTEMDNMGFEDSERSSPARFDKVSDVSDHDSELVDSDVIVHNAHAHANLQGAEEADSFA